MIFHPGSGQSIQSNQTSLGSGVSNRSIYFAALDQGNQSGLQCPARKRSLGNRAAALPKSGVAAILAIDPLTDRAVVTWESSLDAPRLFSVNNGRVVTYRSGLPLFDGSTHIDRTGNRRQPGWSTCSLLDHPPPPGKAGWQITDPSLWLWRLRDIFAAKLPADRRQIVAGARRDLCHCQCEGRWRVGSSLASGGDGRQQTALLRRLRCRCRRFEFGVA